MNYNYSSFKAEDIQKLKQVEGARERTLKAVEEFFEADRKLTELCKELGIEKPEMVCLK